MGLDLVQLKKREKKMPSQLVFWLGLMALGCVGVSLRFFLQTQLQNMSVFPWSTLIVNLVGSLAIGGLYGYTKASVQTPFWLLPVTGGLLGALTTFSSYSMDTVQLIEAGHWVLALTNVLVQNFLGIGCCYLGYWLMRSWWFTSV